ncbi:TonB-dependent receptor plug domain-containing protein [Desulfonatronovibrio hydrogenovorans]|uniref:TonB-dependent receptor plug domain-containing protein n=1 Tax=Desulfonatronovibrio hydrogenovorans TaxID=53245 RepID=UPI00048EA3C2|nr:TonB-dependent receptor [Desulfonatronovibrio hydrogenovorans]
MKLFKSKIVVLVLFIMWTAHVHAEEDVHRIDSIVVSTTRTEISVFDAAQDVSVITREEIEASPFERVEDILRSVPGIFNFRHYGMQTNGIVSPLIMRGVGKNRVLVLVDGVPQNDNFNNGIAWIGWGHIPKDTIERIEIVRGPTSALYGSEGLGGVIHIITKKPGDQRQTSIQGQGGSANTYGGSAFHSQKFNNFGLMLAGSYEESDGFYMVSDREDYEIKRHRDLGRLLGKTTYDIGPESEISLAALYYDYTAGQGRKYFYNEMTMDQYWLNFSHQGGYVGLRAIAYLNRVDKTAFQDTANDNFSSPFRNEKMKGTYTWGADLQTTFSKIEWAPITLGMAFKEAVWKYDEDYPGSARDAGAEARQKTISPFVNMDLRFLDDDLIVNIGGRYDWIETSGGKNWDTQGSAGRPPYDNRYGKSRDKNFSPKMGIAYHPDDRTTLRASGGKGFRAPSLFELYKVHIRGGGTMYREANPDLKPEYIWSYDLGAERFLTDNLWGKFTFYQSWAKDYIGSRLTGSYPFAGGTRTRNEYVLDNISEVDIYGFHAELQWEPVDFTTFFANYTYNISKVGKDSENRELEGNYLPHDPQHALHFGVRYSNPSIVNLTLMANVYDRIYYDDQNSISPGSYWTVDASVSRKFFDHVTLFLNVENIFNNKYKMFRSATSSDTVAPGIVALGGVKFEF